MQPHTDKNTHIDILTH